MAKSKEIPLRAVGGTGESFSTKKIRRNMILNIGRGNITLIGESLGLVLVSRLKVPRLSVSSRSRTKFLRLSRLGLVSYENFSDSLISVSSRLLQFYSVLSRSRPDLDL